MNKTKIIMRFIIKRILWPFEHLTEIIMYALVLGMITYIELLLFKIPEKYWDKIMLGNLLLSYIVFAWTKSLHNKDNE